MGAKNQSASSGVKRASKSRVQLVGIDPDREGISFFADLNIVGENLSGVEDGRIVLGQELARQLQTSVGVKLWC